MEETFTFDTAQLRRWKHELKVGQSIKAPVGYFLKPAPELVKRAKQLGLKFVECEETLGYNVIRI